MELNATDDRNLWKKLGKNLAKTMKWIIYGIYESNRETIKKQNGNVIWRIKEVTYVRGDWEGIVQ